jgi:Sulfotransferase family
MIGWTPKPFIFVHIPKCAGTSIEKALIPIVSDHKDFKDFSEDERSHFWLPGNKGLQHRKLKRYEQHFKLDDYFKFAFVRNPWDRAISQIEYLRSKTGGSLFPSDNFKEHIRVYCNTKKNIWGHDLGACQLDYLKNIAGEMRIDFIGRFESLSVDFKKVCELIGIVDIPSLPHIFKSKRTQHYTYYYDDESARWIKERFAKDVDFFDYKFEEIQTTGVWDTSKTNLLERQIQ